MCREGAPDGEGNDAFHFVLTQEEFLDLFLDDLELPDLLRKQLKLVDGVKPIRAGYSVSGTAANMNIVRTMRHSLARRIALKRPSKDDIAATESELADYAEDGDETDPDRREKLAGELQEQVWRSRRIPFIDPVDIRYNRFTTVPAAGGQRRHVLPDGRLGVDDRAHEGPRQAVLQAALSVPQPTIQAMSRSSSSAIPTWRSEVDEETFFTSYRDPAAPWCRPHSRRCCASSRRAIRSDHVEHLCRPGLGRRQFFEATTASVTDPAEAA